MNSQIKIKIIDTLSYFDVFNFPLTLEEIELYFHYGSVGKKDIKKLINEIPIIDSKYGYYFFIGRDSISIKRKIQEKENISKTNLALVYIFLISKIPGVRLVALTGSLAMKNATKDDDIDLFIITGKNMLWATRFMVVLLVKILGRKRDSKGKKTRDRLCLNMFLDESEMELSEKNLYTAHEIAQMKVFFDKYKVLEEFTKKNVWIQKFFPNIKVKEKKAKRNRKWFDHYLLGEKLVGGVNFILFTLQYIYMSNKITNEKVSQKKAFFHPNDNSSAILGEYRKRRDRYIGMYKINNNYNSLEEKKELSKNLRLQN